MAGIALVHPEYGEIQIRYAPQSIEYQTGGGWDSQPVPGSDDPLLRWAGGPGYKITFTADFVGSKDVPRGLKLLAAARANPWPEATEPPTWSLYIGQKVVAVKILEVALTTSHFDRAMNPGKVSVNITVQKWREFAVSAKGA